MHFASTKGATKRRRINYGYESHLKKEREKKKMKREAKKGGKKKLEMEREERESGPTYTNNESSASTSFEYLKNIYIFAFKNETI